MKKSTASNKGFTIIEVVLVLGIAGLIFLMIFIALPTLQRNSRDARRRDDVIAFTEALKKYQINNRGSLPTTADSGLETVNTSNVYTNTSVKANTWSGFYRDYLPNPFKDPSGDTYGLSVAKCNASASGSCTGSASSALSNLASGTNHSIYVIVQASCQGESVVGSSNPRRASVLYKLEGGGIYCGDL